MSSNPYIHPNMEPEQVRGRGATTHEDAAGLTAIELWTTSSSVSASNDDNPLVASTTGWNAFTCTKETNAEIKINTLASPITAVTESATAPLNVGQCTVPVERAGLLQFKRRSVGVCSFIRGSLSQAESLFYAPDYSLAWCDKVHAGTLAAGHICFGHHHHLCTQYRMGKCEILKVPSCGH